MSLTESEWHLYEALHHPAIFQEFITPVDDRATKILPMEDWLENDHFGFVRPYQYPTLGWDHMFLDNVPIDSHGQEVDRIMAGQCYDWGGRATSKSFGGTHDELQNGVLRPSEESLITSKDDNHVDKRIQLLWRYKESHPLFRVLISHAKQDPFVTVNWWNSHKTYGIPEGTYAQGEAYLGYHFHRINIDEFQLMSQQGWKNLHDCRDKESGCVIRTTGVSDGKVDTPAHKTRQERRYARFVHIKPQMLNERGWSPYAKKNAIESYDGEDTQGYKTNVLAEEGDPVQSAWDIDQIVSCIAKQPSQKYRPIANRDSITCPFVRVNGVPFKRAIEEKMRVYRSDGMTKEKARERATLEEIAKRVVLPAERDLNYRVVLSMDVGQRMSPSIIGVWGLDENNKPHLWCILVIFKVDYPNQAEILKYVIKRYDVKSIGVDATGNDGQAIIQILVRWRSEEEGLFIVPVIFSSTVELPDLTQPKKRGKQPTRKLRVKYYATCQMRSWFQQQEIELLDDYAMFREFRTESAKSSDNPVVGETYSTTTSDHRIDMMRVLALLLFYMDTKQKKRRMRDPKRKMASVTRW